MTQATIGTGAAVTCTYDGFNRLKKVNDNGKETEYTYDADGLRSSKHVTADTENYVYDNGQLVATIKDDPHLLLSKTLTTTRLRWTQGTNPLKAHKYYYVQVNGENYVCYAAQEIQRYAARVTISGEEVPEEPPGSETWPTVLHAGGVNIRITPSFDSFNYTFEISGPAGAQVEVYDSNPVQTSAVYIRGLGLIASRMGNTPTYYHYDAHGNVIQTTDASGNVIHDYTYDAFGVEQNADPADTNPFRYCGEQYDTETGNYYLRARCYTPGVGRFTQEDPIRDGLNWYAYCAGNPVGFLDPLGLAPITYDVRFREIYDGSVDPGSLFGTDYTPTDAFVLYDSSAFSWTNLSSQADLIAEGLLNADSSINRVLKFDTANWSTSDIEEWWNALPSEGVPAVVIHGHGWPDGLQMRTSGKRTGITLDRLNGRRADGDNLNLTMKGIKNLVLFSCNNAHQDKTTNIAYTLAKDYLSPGSHVIGTDGTMFNVIFGYASITSDSAFYRYVSSGSTRTAAGFIKYTVLQDNTVAKTVLGHYSDWIGGLKGITSWLVGGKK